MYLYDTNGAPLGLLIENHGVKPRRSFWARAKEAARNFYHVREPSIWMTLGTLLH